MKNLNDLIWTDEDDPVEPTSIGVNEIQGPHFCMTLFCDVQQMGTEYACRGPIATYTDICLGFLG